MTWAGQTTQKRLAVPSYRPWVPEPFQLKAVKHLVDRNAAGLALDPGLRKTTATLAAYCERQAMAPTRPLKMLVIAPLRVCRKVWRQEGKKWEQFRHLRFRLLHGPKKDQELKDDADIYLMNPEGCDWLCKKFFGRPLPFDIVTIDELTRFKNAASDRSKALRPRLAQVPTVWGLTGSLMPNGHMDLFGQMLMLDQGAALGKYITHYRDMYFQLGFNGFDYDLMPGAEARITAKIAPYWLQMTAEDYITLPPLVPDIRPLELTPSARKLYDKMRKDMIAQLPQGVITAANTAACYSKLSQMANGAVYVGDQKQAVAHIHDVKLDDLEDLIEELDGTPLLVAYEFNHDFDRLRERFGVLDKATGKKVLPYLGKGTTVKQEDAWIDAWNRNELPLLFCHPASAGHGLNLQEGNAGHVYWFGITWDFELWDQFIRRLRRSGNDAQRIINHIPQVKGTIDELKYAALGDKDTSQGRLLRALNTVIRLDAETLAAQGDAVDYRRTDMVTKLSRPASAGTAEAAAPAGEVVRPVVKGWGKPAPVQTDVEDTAPSSQHEKIQEQLTTGGAVEGEVRTDAARSHFGKAVQETARQISTGEERVETVTAEAAGDAAPKPTRNRKAADATQVAAPAAIVPEVHVAVNMPANDGADALAATVRARVAVLAIAFNDPSTSLDDGLDIANDLWKWATA